MTAIDWKYVMGLADKLVHAHNRGNSRTAIEESKSKAYEYLARYMGEYRGQCPLDAFVVKNVRYAMLDYARGLERPSLEFEEEVHSPLSSEEPDMDTTPLAISVVKAMTPNEKRLADLYFWEGLTKRRVGFILGISERQVKYRLDVMFDRLRGYAEDTDATAVC